MEISVCIFGYGNLGQHLYSYFNKCRDFTVHLCTSQKHIPNSLGSDRLRELPEETLVFLCLPDSIVGDWMEKMPKHLIPVICSGAVSIPDLSQREVGVWYPLYSFNANQQVDWDLIPIFCEANGTQVKEKLEYVNVCIHKTPSWLDSKKRAQLHLGAVFVNNFTNALFMAVESTLEDFDKEELMSGLLPIINQTVTRWGQGKAIDHQTGPAKRGDNNTINSHLEMMNAYSLESKLYIEMTQYINKKINKK